VKLLAEGHVRVKRILWIFSFFHGTCDSWAAHDLLSSLLHRIKRPIVHKVMCREAVITSGVRPNLRAYQHKCSNIGKRDLR
jgi:hypothetical protein